MLLYHKVAAKCWSLCSIKEKTVHLRSEFLYINALWFKVMRTSVSPELVWTSYNVAVSLCCILWNETNLNLSRISSFKRSWELLTGVSTCLSDLWISWSLKYNIWRSSQNRIFTTKPLIKNTRDLFYYCVTPAKVRQTFIVWNETLGLQNQSSYEQQAR